MARSPQEFIDEIYESLGIPKPKPKGFFRSAWDTTTEPVKDVLGFTQNIGARGIGLLAPDAYKAAEEEVAGMYGTTPGEDWKAAPGVGDVAMAALPESVREAGITKVLEPAVRIGGNILGDPINLLPGGLLGSAAKGLVGTSRLGRAAGAFVKASEAIPGVARAGRFANSPLIGAAYAPELVEGTVGGATAAMQGLATGDPTEFFKGLVEAGISGFFAKGLAQAVHGEVVSIKNARAAAKQKLIETGHDPDAAEAKINRIFGPEFESVGPAYESFGGNAEFNTLGTARPENYDPAAYNAAQERITEENTIPEPEPLIPPEIAPEDVAMAQLRTQALTAQRLRSPSVPSVSPSVSVSQEPTVTAPEEPPVATRPTLESQYGTVLGKTPEQFVAELLGGGEPTSQLPGRALREEAAGNIARPDVMDAGYPSVQDVEAFLTPREATQPASRPDEELFAGFREKLAAARTEVPPQEPPKEGPARTIEEVVAAIQADPVKQDIARQHLTWAEAEVEKLSSQLEGDKRGKAQNAGTEAILRAIANAPEDPKSVRGWIKTAITNAINSVRRTKLSGKVVDTTETTKPAVPEAPQQAPRSFSELHGERLQDPQVKARFEADFAAENAQQRRTEVETMLAEGSTWEDVVAKHPDLGNVLYQGSGRAERVNPRIVEDYLRGMSYEDLKKKYAPGAKKAPTVTKARSAIEAVLGPKGGAKPQPFRGEEGSGIQLGREVYLLDQEAGFVPSKTTTVTTAGLKKLVRFVYANPELPGSIRIKGDASATRLLVDAGYLVDRGNGNFDFGLLERPSSKPVDVTSPKPAAGETIDFLGLPTTARLLGRVAQSGFEAAEPVARRAYELIASGVKDSYQFSRRMISEFGDKVKAVLRDLYDWATDAVERLANKNPKVAQALGDLFIGSPEAVASKFGPEKLGKKELELNRGASSLEEPLPSYLPQKDYGYKPVPPELAEGLLNRSEDTSPVGTPKGKTLSGERVPNISLNTRLMAEMDVEARKDVVALHEMINSSLARATPERHEKIRRAIPTFFATHDMDEFLKQMKEEGAFNAKEMSVLQHLNDKHLKQLIDAKRALQAAKGDESKTDAALVNYFENYARSLEVVLTASDERTRAGRLLRVLGMQRRQIDPFTSRQGKLRSALIELGVSAERADEILTLFRAGDFDNAHRMLDLAFVPNMSDKIRFLYTTNLISPPGQVANAVSNFSNNYMRELDKVAASLVDAARSKFTGKERLLVNTPLDISAKVQRNAWAEAGGQLKDNLLKILRGEALPVELAHEQVEFYKRNPFKGSTVMGYKIPDKLAEHLGNNFKLLDAMDRMQYVLSLQRELAGIAWTKAYNAAKGDIKAARAGFDEIFNELNLARQYWDPRAWVDANGKFDEKRRTELLTLFRKYEKELKHANKIADEDRFQAPLEGIFRKFAEVQRNNLLMAFVAPFVKTPSNIMLQTIRRSPLGLFSLVKRAKEGKFKGELGQRYLVDEVGKLLVGNILGGMFVSMAFSGALTGGGPGDPEKEELLKSAGWQPYAIKFPDGSYRSYTRVEPLSSILGMAADMAEGYRNGDYETVNKTAKRFFGSLGENLTNKTFLAGLEGIFTAWSDPLRFGDRFIRQQIAGVFPTSVAGLPVGQLARVTDDTYRRTNERLIDPIVAKIPGASETLEPQMTPTGQPRKRLGTAVERLVSPFPTSKEESTEDARLASELSRIDYVPSAPRRYEFVGGVKVNYTQDEIKALQEAHRQASKEAIRLLNNPNYQALPDTDLDAKNVGQKTKRDVMENLYRRFRRKALARLRGGITARGIEQRNRMER